MSLNNLRHILFTLICFVAATAFADAVARPSNENAPEDSIDTNRDWIHLIKKGKFNIYDTTVNYPKFAKFCVDVYRWGDRTFNSYDTTYVVGTGRNWKTRLVWDAWNDSYYMNLSHKHPMLMVSEPYNTLSIFIHFMAVSYSAGIDVDNVFRNKPIHHKKMEFGFNCARFNLDLAWNQNTGGTYLRKFGNYKKGHFFKEFFPGVKLNSLTADLYYYFNNRKYANGAAYYFSKIQKKSAGSFMAGFSYAHESVDFDFSQLPPELIPYNTLERDNYKFKYNSYHIMGGYGYNWVWNKHFLFNISAMPSLGVMHVSEGGQDGSKILFSMAGKGRASITYNNGDYFICAVAKADGHWFNSHSITLFNTITNIQVSVGKRF